MAGAPRQASACAGGATPGTTNTGQSGGTHVCFSVVRCWKSGKPTITAKKPFSVNHLHGNMRQWAGIDPGAGTVDNLV